MKLLIIITNQRCKLVHDQTIDICQTYINHNATLANLATTLVTNIKHNCNSCNYQQL